MRKVYIEVGKRYIAKNGTVVGPMEDSFSAGLFRCSNRSLRQADSPASSQIWNRDGSVRSKVPGEDGHELVAELKIFSAEELALSATNFKLSQLQGEFNDLSNKFAAAAAEVEKLKSSRDEARTEAEKWKSLYFGEKFLKDTSINRRIAPPFGRYASGGVVGATSTDVVRSLDKRIDGAFDVIWRLQSDFERDRKSINGRAIFFGSLGSVIVVAVAFLAHFLF